MLINIPRLVMGTLQLAPGTHLTIDETNMQCGTLNSKGVENASLLKHLMEWQTVTPSSPFFKHADKHMHVLRQVLLCTRIGSRDCEWLHKVV